MREKKISFFVVKRFFGLKEFWQKEIALHFFKKVILHSNHKRMCQFGFIFVEICGSKKYRSRPSHQ
jgi:hypothetical protein